jgi:hypothetical protein
MSNQETVKLEIELPKDQVEHLLAGATDSPSVTEDLDKELNKEKRIAKFKKQLAEAKEGASSQDDKDNSLPEKASSAIKSPLSVLPQTSDTSPPNPNQKKVIFIGLAVALIGLLLWPLSNFIIASVIAMIGAAVVATGTFVKV